jgi:hypothetical protein
MIDIEVLNRWVNEEPIRMVNEETILTRLIPRLT